MNELLIQNIKGEIYSVSIILISFIIGIPIYKIEPELSRKEIHIMLGNFYFIALHYFTKWYFASLGPFVFIFVNFFSVKYKLIKVMLRREEDINKDIPKKNDDINPKNNLTSNKEKIKYKNDYGTVFYAISLFILTTYSWSCNNPSLGLCPFLFMAYGDGLACVIGKTIKTKSIIIFGSRKSISGSSTMFLVCFILSIIYFWYYQINYFVIKSLVIGIIITIFEVVSPFGTDNLTVPLGGLLLFKLLM